MPHYDRQLSDWFMSSTVIGQGSSDQSLLMWLRKDAGDAGKDCVADVPQDENLWRSLALTNPRSEGGGVPELSHGQLHSYY